MITWVNGTFDILNVGHINLFREASKPRKIKNHKDPTFLVVGVDSDERVRELKGYSRPIVPLEQRIEVLKSIKYVNQVVSFSTDDELRIRIKESGAKRMCVSPEYKGKIIGEELFDEIVYVPRVEGVNSSDIIDSYL